jgi:O-antigen/teichoic acid export membrane protein
MTGHERQWLVLTAVVAAVDLALLAWLVPLWGVLGAAIATTCALGILYVLGTLLVWRFLGVWPYDRRYLKGLLAALVTSGALGLLRWQLPWPPFPLLVSAGVVAVLIFAGTLLALKLDPEDKEFIQIVRARALRLAKGGS